jgi:hypothetical protein
MLMAHSSRRSWWCRCRQVGPDASGPLGLVLLVSRSLGRGATISKPLRCVNLAPGFSGSFPDGPVAVPRGAETDCSGRPPTRQLGAGSAVRAMALLHRCSYAAW